MSFSGVARRPEDPEGDPSGTPVVVLGAFYVVLAEIFPRLHFDENEIPPTCVQDAMPRTPGDIYGLTAHQGYFRAFSHNHRLTLDQEPVFSPSTMALETEALPRVHDDPLYLVLRPFGKYLVGTPRTAIFLESIADLFRSS